MELIKIVYEYVNRFINSEELINRLDNIDRGKFSDEELKELDKLIKEIKNTINNTKITIDDIEIQRQEKLDRMINKLEDVYNNARFDSEESKINLDKNIKSLKKEKTRKRDSGERYESIMKVFCNDSLYKKIDDNMTLEEALTLITSYIYVPRPPKITQKEFDKLVDLAINKDNREGLWRLANNYANRGINFDRTIDYYIEKKDTYYLVELISALLGTIDIDEIIDKLAKLNDKKFYKNFMIEADKIKLFDEDEKKNIINKLNS